MFREGRPATVTPIADAGKLESLGGVHGHQLHRVFERPAAEVGRRPHCRHRVVFPAILGKTSTRLAKPLDILEKFAQSSPAPPVAWVCCTTVRPVPASAAAEVNPRVGILVAQFSSPVPAGCWRWRDRVAPRAPIPSPQSHRILSPAPTRWNLSWQRGERSARNSSGSR